MCSKNLQVCCPVIPCSHMLGHFVSAASAVTTVWPAEVQLVWFVVVVLFQHECSGMLC